MQIVDKIVVKPINEITPYEKNPRKNSKTVELLVKAIPKVGFNVPLVLDKDGVIVKGHARYLAAKELGMSEVPCVISEADPESIRADRIADNKVFEFSKWVNEELLHEIDMLDLGLDLGEFGLQTFKMEVPDFDFEADTDDEEDFEDNQETDEERRRRFEQFMAQQEQEAPQVQIVTPMEIEQAKQKLKEEPQKNQASYISVTCEKCGHVFFVREGDAIEWE